MWNKKPFFFFFFFLVKRVGLVEGLLKSSKMEFFAEKLSKFQVCGLQKLEANYLNVKLPQMI